MQSIHNIVPCVGGSIVLFAIYQRYEMQSIHNTEVASDGFKSAVCDISKIRNVVNSQLMQRKKMRKIRCLRYIKDTKCSQFTTKGWWGICLLALFAIYQRYEMQSIHNLIGICSLPFLAVCDISKIRNVVNSQQLQRHLPAIQLFAIYQRYEMQSIHNTVTADNLDRTLFAIYQRYEMQSIHNTMLGQMTVNSAVCDISKIRNVVNSQRGRSLNSTPLCCLRYIKDTKCSQFTTF